MLNTLITLIVKFFGLLPLRGARMLGRGLGHCLWYTKSRSYRITLKNIRLCFSELNEPQQKQLAHESLLETATTAAEAGVIWHNSWEWLQGKIVAVEGEDILRAELAQGKGLIVLAPHLGNWEVVAPYLASIAPLTAMYKPFSVAKLDKLIYDGRSKLNISMAPANRKGVAMLLKALQQGTIVGILPDQVPGEGAGVEVVDFFGHSAKTMGLVHSLIDRTDCRVVSVFAMRVPDGFKLITLPATHTIYSKDSIESLTGMNTSIEQCVRLAPAQYQWEYNRFRGMEHRIKKIMGCDK